MEPFTLTSSTFKDGGMIPEDCTCDGANQSPGLQWSGAPLNTQSFVLIADDSDAPHDTFTHWVLFDIPKAVQTLDAGQPVVGIAGINDFQEPGYSGPCPPPGDRAHSYRFTLYALDVSTIDLGNRVTRHVVERVMRNHVIARAQLTGRYRRHERSAQA
jgi:Raf kinase inhibitor-like YbhB/YbcL family protein